MGKRRFGALSVRARVLLRQIQATPSAVLSIFVVVFVVGLFVTGVPRLFERVSNEDLLDTVEGADPAQRNIEFMRRTSIGFGSQDPFVHVDRRGEFLMETEMTPAVSSIITDTQFVFEMPRYQVLSFPDGVEGPFPTTFVYRFQEGIDDHMTLVEGRLPMDRDPVPMFFGPECPEDVLDTEGFEVSEDVLCEVDQVPVFEAMVTRETAEAMMLEIGEMALLRPDGGDLIFLTASSFHLERRLILSISGFVEFSDVSNEYWFGDNVLHQPRITENPDFRLVGATGIMNPDHYRDLIRAVPFINRRYSWRYFVDPELVKGSALETLSIDVAQLSAVADYQVSSRLPELLSEYVAQRELTIELMSISVASLVAVALGVVLLLAVLIAVQQRASVVQIRNRGASRGQLLLTSFYRGLLLVVPAAIAGYLLAAVLIPEADPLPPQRAGFALGVIATFAVALAALPLIRSRLGAIQGEDFWPGASAARRVVFEVLVMVAAVGSILILRRRGQIEDAPTSQGFDALLAFAPAVIGGGVAVVTLRVYRPIVATLAWLGSKARSLVPFVGFKRVLGQHGSGWLSLVVVLVAVGVAIFSVIARTSVGQGQEEHGWQIVGADYRVNAHERGVSLPRPDEVLALEGFDDIAPGSEIPDTSIVGQGLAADAFLLALDVARYREIAAGAPEDVPLPSGLEGVDMAGTVTNPISAVISTDWSRDGTPDIGSLLDLEIGSVNPVIRVDAIVDRHPSMPVTAPFAIVDLASLRSFLGDLVVPPTVAYATAPASRQPDIEARLLELSPTLRLDSRHELMSDLADDPFARLVNTGLLLVTVGATTLAVGTAVASVALASARRRKDVGYLGTMGLTSRQATSLTILEQLPTMLVATLVGMLLGVGVAVLLAAVMPLDSFTGSLLPTQLRADPVWVAGVGIALLASVVLAVVVFVLTTRDDQSRLLRVGDE